MLGRGRACGFAFASRQHSKALAASRTLIVICSSETQESSWVRREIDVRADPRARAHHLCPQAARESIPPILKTACARRQRRFAGNASRTLAADLRPRLRPSAKPSCASSPPSPAAATTISANASEPVSAGAWPSRPRQQPSPSPPSAFAFNFTKPARRHSSRI
ncbi:MAG: TIR domain-containing protein [Coriobacteriaceae bacterium]